MIIKIDLEKRKVDNSKFILDEVLTKIEKNTPPELQEESTKITDTFRNINFFQLSMFLDKINEHIESDIEMSLEKHHTPKKIICKKYKISFNKLQRLLKKRKIKRAMT